MDYKDKRWLKKRGTILKRDGYECRECRRYGRTIDGVPVQATTVHHVRPVEDHPELYLVDKNLYSCCNSCHNSFHDRVTNELTAKGQELVNRIYR